MAYVFSPVRFSLLLFALTIGAAVLVGLLRSVAGVDLGGGAIAVVTFLAAISLEAHRFGKALTTPPVPQECWVLARQVALTGTATFLVLLVGGIALIRGGSVFAEPKVLIEPFVLMAMLGVAAYVAGFFIIRAMALSAWKDRA